MAISPGVSLCFDRAMNGFSEAHSLDGQVRHALFLLRAVAFHIWGYFGTRLSWCLYSTATDSPAGIPPSWSRPAPQVDKTGYRSEQQGLPQSIAFLRSMTWKNHLTRRVDTARNLFLLRPVATDSSSSTATPYLLHLFGQLPRGTIGSRHCHGIIKLLKP
jgi:hypothetical protein